MTPYMTGLIHELKKVNSVEKDNQYGGKGECAYLLRILTTVRGIQQTPNPITVARRTRDA